MSQFYRDLYGASCAVHAARQKSVGLQEVVSGFIANARHWPTSCESEAEN